MTKEKFTKAVYEQVKTEYNEPLSVSKDVTDNINWFFNFYLNDTNYPIEIAIAEAVESVIDESINESLYWDN